MYRHLIVPLDGTPLAPWLTEQALALAAPLQARVSFVHVQPDFAASSDGAVLHSVAPSTFRDCAAGHAQAVLARAAAAARAARVPHETRVLVGAQPADLIVAAADEIGADLIVMASHGRHGWQALRAPSITRRVLQQARHPVLVVAVESRLALDAAARAVSQIKAEHRSMGAVLHGLLQVWQQARAAGQEPDFALLRAMLFYIAQYPERLHHPKEDAYLFVRLRERTAELDAVIAHLQQQHREGAAQFEALQRELQAVQGGTAGAAEAFGQSLEAFVRTQWRHMAEEEQLVLPAAQTHLTQADWQAIAAAFGENGDARFGSEQAEAFDDLFKRVLRLAPAPAGQGTPMQQA